MPNLSVERIDDYRWRVPREGRMRTEGLIFATEAMMAGIRGDPCVEQVANVACLPGIVGKSMAMPDIHWGYGFPIGGVAAFDADAGGVVSPGGVGYDINCGVRLIRTDLRREGIADKFEDLMSTLFRSVPSGVGSQGHVKVKAREMDELLVQGARWAVDRGYGTRGDLERIEEGGRMKGADPSLVSPRAKERGKGQLGSLGSGNHFLEIDVVEEVFDEAKAARLELFQGQVVAFVHTGSRGLGHQTCEDYLDLMDEAARKYRIELPDRQLCCAPLHSPEAEKYLGAMRCAVNFAFANRQMITHWVREAFERVLKKSPEEMGMRLVYGVAHNIAKMEEYEVGGKKKILCIHRKGATRAFPPGNLQIPEAYRPVGQPVLIPGDMGRYSFVLTGTEGSFRETWGSTCHGAGRRMSRKKASRAARGRRLFEEMSELGVTVKAASVRTVAEEMPESYKDVADVVDAVAGAGLSVKVAKLRPIGVVKG
ncbi:MAG: RtcB family protein [Acidobacteriota bacterium]|nr:MAG: RtcB family protein [Acidobacteriota bacterium]